MFVSITAVLMAVLVVQAIDQVVYDVSYEIVPRELEIVGPPGDFLVGLHRGDVVTTEFTLENTGTTTIDYELYICNQEGNLTIDSLSGFDTVFDFQPGDMRRHLIELSVVPDASFGAFRFLIRIDDVELDKIDVCAGSP